MIKKEFTLLNSVKKAPFYAVRMEIDSTYMSGTHGGSKIDTNGHVINTDGKSLKGCLQQVNLPMDSFWE